MAEILDILRENHLLLLFLSVAIGYLIGNLKFGDFKLGETIGALLAGICLSFLGFVPDHELSTMCFSIFMFATGYGSSENIMSVFKKSSIKHVVLALILMLISWMIIVFNVKVLGFSKALAIGNAAGLLTNTAIVGVATDAIGNVANNPLFAANLTEAFSVSYFISMCITVMWCSTGIEAIFRRKINIDAQQDIKKFNNSFYEQTQHFKSKRPLLIISCGLTLGLLLGEIKLKIFGASFILGSLGSLMAGIIIGHISHKKNHIAYLQNDDISLLQTFGLSTFIAAIGLAAGSSIVKNFADNGLMLIQVSVIESLILLMSITLIGKFILRYKNVAEFGGALAGARCASAGCAIVIDKAQNNYPVPSFVITFILANFISTLFGPMIVFLL